MRRKTVFIFAYYSFQDPVFQSAVLPYFIGLHVNTDLNFVLITFEQQRFKMSAVKVREADELLKKNQIIWYRTNWHSGKFKVVKKMFDFLFGFLYTSCLIIRHKPKAIYSEGFPGAIIAHHLAKFFSLPHLVHTFEPHTDYMVESGVWHEKSWEAILLKRYEVKVAKGAKYIFTATNAMIEKLKELNLQAEIIRVPSCVDLNVFRFSSFDRIAVRKENEIKNDACVISYLGKFGGMYMDREIFRFFKLCEKCTTTCFRYFIFTQDPKEEIFNYILQEELDPSKFMVKPLERSEVSKYLSASDFGLVPVRQFPGKRYCSPIKDGEYWACGLPIIIPKGISDDFIFAETKNIGIVLENMDEQSLEMAIKQIENWVRSYKKEEVVEKCVQFVKDDRSIEKFKTLYQNIFLEL